MNYVPLYREGDVPFYAISDINTWGLPELFGVWRYCVVDDVVEYKGEVGWEGRTRPEKSIHHYNRMERFKATVMHVTGNGGKIPLKKLRGIGRELSEWDIDYEDRDNVWENIFWVLSKSGNGKYFNRIGEILKFLGHEDGMVVRGSDRYLNLVLGDFERMSAKFDYLKQYGLLSGSRKYFPRLRYCAVRLCRLHGVVFNYFVPVVKTPSKVDTMNNIFNELF